MDDKIDKKEVEDNDKEMDDNVGARRTTMTMVKRRTLITNETRRTWMTILTRMTMVT